MQIILAVRDPVMRSALRLLLEQEPWVDTVSEAGANGALASATYPGHAGLLLLDCEAAGVKPAAETISGLRQACPDLKIIALSSHPENECRELSAGADGFVSISDSPGRVLAVLRKVAGRRKEAAPLSGYSLYVRIFSAGQIENWWKVDPMGVAGRDGNDLVWAGSVPNGEYIFIEIVNANASTVNFALDIVNAHLVP